MQIKIISASKKVFESNNVDKVSIPTTTGRICVLKKHSNLLSTLELGELIITFKNNVEKRLVLNGGLLQVVNDEILILADEAYLEENLVAEEIEEAIRRAEEQISTEKLQPSELIQLEKQLKFEKFMKEKAGK